LNFVTAERRDPTDAADESCFYWLWEDRVPVLSAGNFPIAAIGECAFAWTREETLRAVLEGRPVILAASYGLSIQSRAHDHENGDQ